MWELKWSLDSTDVLVAMNQPKSPKDWARFEKQHRQFIHNIFARHQPSMLVVPPAGKWTALARGDQQAVWFFRTLLLRSKNQVF